MSQLPATIKPGTLTTPASSHLVPALIAEAGEPAAWRYIEFFTANIRNPNTRRAYARACNQFFAWCEDRGLTLTTIRPFDVATYMVHPQSLLQPKARGQNKSLKTRRKAGPVSRFLSDMFFSDVFLHKLTYFQSVNGCNRLSLQQRLRMNHINQEFVIGSSAEAMMAMGFEQSAVVGLHLIKRWVISFPGIKEACANQRPTNNMSTLDVSKFKVVCLVIRGWRIELVRYERNQLSGSPCLSVAFTRNGSRPSRITNLQNRTHLRASAPRLQTKGLCKGIGH